MEELKAKIADYRERIARLEAQIAKEDENTSSGRMCITEAKREIKDYQERIARLESRLAGTEDAGPTDEQIKTIKYVNSRAYDQD